MQDELYAYTRISPTELDGDTKEEKEASADRLIELQKADIQNHALLKFPDKRIVWFSDKLISGTSLVGRDDFNRMIKEACDQKPYAIIFTKVDRFARSMRDLINTAELLKQAGVNIVATGQIFDTTTPYGDFLFKLLGLFAELEAVMIKERTGRGKKEKQKRMEAEGRNWGRPKNVVRDKLTGQKKTLDPAEVLKLYQIKGSIRAVAEELHCSIKPIINIIRESENSGSVAPVRQAEQVTTAQEPVQNSQESTEDAHLDRLAEIENNEFNADQ